MCVWDYALQQNDKTIWWLYTTLFRENCPMIATADPSAKLGQKCSQNVIAELGNEGFDSTKMQAYGPLLYLPVTSAYRAVAQAQ